MPSVVLLKDFGVILFSRRLDHFRCSSLLVSSRSVAGHCSVSVVNVDSILHIHQGSDYSHWSLHKGLQRKTGVHTTITARISGPHPGNLKIFRSVSKVLVFTSICGPENFRSILSVQETCTKAYESEYFVEADVKSGRCYWHSLYRIPE